MTDDQTPGLEGLEAKNRELLAELKATKARLRATEGVTPEALAAVEAERDALKASLDKAAREVKTWQGEHEKALKALSDEQAAASESLIGRTLAESLAAAGVTNPAHARAAAALLRGGATVKDRQALLGEKPLADAVKEWAGGEEGKHFVAAPVNTGGGAPGGMKTPPGQKSIDRAAFLALGPAAQMDHVKNGGAITE